MEGNQIMYVSITKSKAKKGHSWKWDKGKSRALKNPKFIPAKPYTFTSSISGKETIHHGEYAAKIEGEPIMREPRPSYNLRVGESRRIDGKVKSVQKHLYSFSELDIIDEVMAQEELNSEYQPGWCFDYEWIEKKVKEAFPSADMKALWLQIQDKMKPIEDPIIVEFKQSDEYRWWRKTLKLKIKMKADHERQRQEKRRAKAKEQKQQEQYQRQSYQQSYRQSNDTSLPAGLTLSTDEAGLIKRCYREMSKAVHPDKGGTDGDMAMLNSLMDRIKA